MPPEPSLRERFWHDVAMAAGHRGLDPNAIREAIEDMMRNYRLEEVPGFEASEANALNVPDTSNFKEHSTFSPVFSRHTSNMPWGCFRAARPIFVGPRCMLRRRKTRLEPRNPEHFPGGGNPGIHADTGSVSPFAAPFALGRCFNAGSVSDQQANPTPSDGGLSLWSHLPQLPPCTPHHCVWVHPNGHLAWSPHPQPHPPLSHPLSPWSAVALTGGHPLPGTMPQWTPGTWPPLNWVHDIPIHLSPHIIPNPNNANLPLIDWNVTKHPSTAKRLTPNHVVVDMSSILEHPVTDTNASTIVVTCDVGYMTTLWGPAVIDRNEPVTLHDLLEAIYQYFQIPLTYPEVQYIFNLHPSNYHRLTDAYYERCRESTALPGWEARQGFRRVDVLGDLKYWWGVWISSRDGVWWLNLGLMNPAHRVPCR